MKRTSLCALLAIAALALFASAPLTASPPPATDRLFAVDFALSPVAPAPLAAIDLASAFAVDFALSPVAPAPLAAIDLASAFTTNISADALRANPGANGSQVLESVDSVVLLSGATSVPGVKRNGPGLLSVDDPSYDSFDHPPSRTVRES